MGVVVPLLLLLDVTIISVVMAVYIYLRVDNLDVGWIAGIIGGQGVLALIMIFIIVYYARKEHKKLEKMESRLDKKIMMMTNRNLDL